MASPSPIVTPFSLQCSFSLFVFLYRRANSNTAPVFSKMFCITKAFPITQASFNNRGFQTLPILPLKYRCGYVKTDPWQSFNTLLHPLCPKLEICPKVWDLAPVMQTRLRPQAVRAHLGLGQVCSYHRGLQLPEHSPSPSHRVLLLHCTLQWLPYASPGETCKRIAILMPFLFSDPAVQPLSPLPVRNYPICCISRDLQEKFTISALLPLRTKAIHPGDVRNECPGSAACFCLQEKRQVP